MSLKAIYANNTVFSKLLLVIGIILMGAAFFTVASALMAAGIFGVSFLQLGTMLNDYDNPLAISILKFIQTVSTIGIFIIPAFVIAWLFDENALGYLKLSRRPPFITVILVFILLFSALPLINYLGEINSKVSLPSWLSGIEQWMKDSEDNAAKITEKFLEINSPMGFV